MKRKPEISYRYLAGHEDKTKYKTIGNYSRRFKNGKTLHLPHDYPSDGATGAPDIESDSWWWHDKACDDGCWADGSLITNWECANIIREVLWGEGHPLRAVYWHTATFIFGGGKARKNGFFKI